MNLMMRSQAKKGEIAANKELGRMRIYLRDLIQTSFDFLVKIMHLAAAIVKNSSVLSQIC